MQRTTNKKRIVLKLKSMPIGDKITLMYGSFFAIMLILSTIFILLNAWYFYQGTSKAEINETLNKVEEYIKSGGVINASEISRLNPNKYVEIRVINLNNFKRFETMHDPGKYPPVPNEYNITKWEKENLPHIGKDEYNREYNSSDQERNMLNNNDKYKEVPPERDEKFGRLISAERILEYKNGKYLIQAFRLNEREYALIKIYAIAFIVVNVVGILMAFGIGRFISKKMLKPVKEMTETAKGISIYDLTQRINVPEAKDEIRTLAVTFNDMIGRLQASFEKQKQFISDASHELRTPISVIQGYANLIDRWGKSDPEVLQEAINSIKDETGHMTTLIKKLLFLAKDEQNKKNVQKKVLFLNGLLNEIYKEIGVLETHQTFDLEELADVYIFADTDLIKQMIWIFIENAIKYSDEENGKILIKLEKEDDKAVLSISDNGIGIKEEDIDYIFDRFYRGDKSRSQEVPGNGLGLSIADWIIKQHNAEVKVESVFGEGTVFKIYFNICDEGYKDKTEEAE